MYNQQDVEEITKLIIGMARLGFSKAQILDKAWNMSFATVQAYNDIEKQPLSFLYPVTLNLLNEAVILSIRRKKGEKNVNKLD